MSPLDASPFPPDGVKLVHLKRRHDETLVLPQTKRSVNPIPVPTRMNGMPYESAKPPVEKELVDVRKVGLGRDA
jgi:hypothetical protein